eukprot:352475-Pyramimonas_sp.AAC.1
MGKRLRRRRRAPGKLRLITLHLPAISQQVQHGVNSEWKDSQSNYMSTQVQYNRHYLGCGIILWSRTEHAQLFGHPRSSSRSTFRP